MNTPVDPMREIYQKRRDYVCQRPKTMNLSFPEPEGAFYIFPCIKQFGMTSEEFANNLLQEEKVAVVPGNGFDAPDYVRWSYATRLIYNPKTSEKNIKRAVDILLPLAEEGYPCAVGDLAYCYRYGLGVELSYEKAICLWEMASRKGYCKARECLKMEYDMRCSKELPEELRLFLVHRVLWMFIEDHNLPVVNYIIYPDGLSADATKVLSRIFNEHKRLRKSVQEKSYLRHCGQLCWSDEDNPYSIGIKIK